MKDKLYISIIGDLVKSREIEDRKAVQKRLQQIMDECNKEFAPYIAAKFVITLGDEFQALVLRDFPFETFFDLYEERFGSEYATRFGIGIGSVTTELQESALGMDGPCFHHARAALDQAKKSRKEVVLEGFEYNTALTALFDAMLDIKRGWTERQKEVIAKYRQLGNLNDVADKLAVAKQTVFKILANAKWELYISAWKGITELLQEE